MLAAWREGGSRGGRGRRAMADGERGGAALPATELLLVGGVRIVVAGSTETVEAAVLAAARGSIMQLAWLTELEGGDRLGVNPDHVVLVREVRVPAGEG
jgi:hypothetical protein